MFLSPVILFALVSISSATICRVKKPCDLEDYICTTQSINLMYHDFITGNKGVPRSDPIYQDVIEGKLPSLSYKYTNSSLSGLKNCRLGIVKLISSDLKYEFSLICPCLTIETQCEIKGEVRSKIIDGEGICKVDLNEYHIHFSGDYENVIDEYDEVHFGIKTIEIQLDCKGKIEHDYKNLVNHCDDKEGEEKPVLTKEDWRSVEKNSRETTVKVLLEHYVDHFKVLTALIPNDVLFAL